MTPNLARPGDPASILRTNLWLVQPEIHVLGLSLKSFGIVFAFGFIAAGAILVRRLKELGKPVDWAYEMAFAAMIGGLVGSRLYYVIQNYSLVKHDLIGSLFSGSGLVWYGGVIGGALAVIGWAAWRGMLSLALLDLASVPLAMGYAIGRIGCQVSGDGDYGKVSNLPWAMGYPHGTVPTPPGVKVQPTPIYETVTMGLIAWWLWRMRDRFRPGALFAFYLMLSGAERLLVEFVRRNNRVLLGLTAPQIESIGLVIAGAAWLWWMARRGGLSAGVLRPGGAVPA
jgi:phosphatidylglycerol:prolipoprotein diacylglycerol transferase